MSAPAPRLLTREPSAKFTLGQTWNAVPEAGLRPTRVWAGFADGVLLVRAELADDDVFNDARSHNARTWELGDVFEIFARRDDEEQYVEVHVTPDNVKLHLRFADFGHAARIASIDEVAGDPAQISSSARRTAYGWEASARVPLRAGPGELVRVSFCRYDATRGREPMLSSSSPHPVLRFHRPLEWTLCRIAEEAGRR